MFGLVPKIGSQALSVETYTHLRHVYINQSTRNMYQFTFTSNTYEIKDLFCCPDLDTPHAYINSIYIISRAPIHSIHSPVRSTPAATMGSTGREKVVPV